MSTMQEIDIATWKRKEHFSFFRKADLPFYNITAPVDISGLKEFAKTQACSFNTLLVYLTTKAMNTVENFKFRLRGETVVLHDRIHPSFAHLKNGDDLFSLITVDFSDDLSAFDQTVRAAIAACDSYFNLAHLKGRDDFVFISSIPWISFTGIDHTLSLKKNDAIPRVTWGKYFDDNGRTLLPFNIQVNHMFVDGLHVGRFFAKLDRDIQAIRTLKRESDTCG